ncbi:MAG: hypothetical protein ABRQ23_03405 [Syntrophomonadaceae bacterium]
MSKRIEPLIFSISLAMALLSISFKSPSMDSDVFWSMAVGKWIVDHKSFPVVDSFSWTIYGKEWFTHEWLYCLGAYKMYSIWGKTGLYILTLLPMVLTIYFLYRICKQYDKNDSFTFLLILTIGALLLYKICLPFRAYIFALLFFTTLIYLMYFKDENKVDVLYYAVLFMIWANFHVSVCMGFIILAMEMIRRIVVNNRYSFLWVVIVSMLSTLINPYGQKIWTYFFFTITSMGESRLIAEWQAPDFNSPSVLTFWVLLAVSIVFFQYLNAYCIPRSESHDVLARETESGTKSTLAVCSYFSIWRKLASISQQYLSSTTCLIVLFWGFYLYSLYSFRMIYYALILWIIVISLYVGEQSKLNFTIRTHIILVGLFVVFFGVNLTNYDPSSQSIFEYNKKISPVEEVAFLKDNPIYQQHLFNSYIFGGYLILNDIPVYIDARSDSYIKFGIMKQYGDIALLLDNPQKGLDETGVKNIIAMRGDPFAWYLTVNPSWQLVYEGPNACIYTRTVDNQI